MPMRTAEHTVRIMNAYQQEDVNQIAARMWADADVVDSSNKLRRHKAAGEVSEGLGYCRAWVLDRMKKTKATCKMAGPLPKTATARAPMLKLTEAEGAEYGPAE